MKKGILLIIVVVAIILCAGGFALAWDIVKTVAYAFFSTFVALLPFLDLEQEVLCKFVTILITQVLCGAGFFVSYKTKSIIGQIVSGMADAIATVLLFIA